MNNRNLTWSSTIRFWKNCTFRTDAIHVVPGAATSLPNRAAHWVGKFCSMERHLLPLLYILPWAYTFCAAFRIEETGCLKRPKINKTQFINKSLLKRRNGDETTFWWRWFKLNVNKHEWTPQKMGWFNPNVFYKTVWNYSHPQIDGKVNHHQISRDLLFHLFGDDYIHYYSIMTSAVAREVCAKRCVAARIILKRWGCRTWQWSLLVGFRTTWGIYMAIPATPKKIESYFQDGVDDVLYNFSIFLGLLIQVWHGSTIVCRSNLRFYFLNNVGCSYPLVI